MFKFSKARDIINTIQIHKGHGMETFSTEKIGSIIKSHRKNLGITQFELAELVGIDGKQIGKIERGIHYPSVPTFLKIIKILQINVEKFYSENNDTTTQRNNKLSRLIHKLTPKQTDKLYKIAKIVISE